MAMIPSPVEITQALVRIDTRNPPGREVECADYLARLLGDAGLEVHRHEFAENRTSLVARLKGKGNKAPICFAGHIDVVPLGTRPWSVDPFGAEIIDGKMYGRGTCDMKAGIAAFVHMALVLAQEGHRGEADIEMAICAGEETGCEGSFHLGRTGALGPAGAIVIAEPTSNYPIIGHRGALWLKVETTGITAHGSMPHQGDNAVYKAARAVSKLEAFTFEVIEHELLGSCSLNVGTFHGGINLNSVPDHAEFTVDIRSIPDQDHREMLQGLSAYLGKDAGITPLVNVGAVHTSHDHPWVQEVYAVMSAMLGERMEPRGAPYFTDAGALTPAYGMPPTIILGPGDMEMAHKTDEYCSIHQIDQAAAAYREIARRWLEI